MKKKFSVKKIKIEANRFWDKGDRKMAKIMEKLVNYQYEEIGGVMEAISSMKQYIELAYGVPTKTEEWNGIMKAVVKMRMEMIKRYETPDKFTPSP